jgi:hypothetical protein
MEAMTIMNNEASGPAEEMPIYVICPCNCGRDIAYKNTSRSGDISEMAIQAWQRLACEKGLEGAIEFLHKSVDVS